MVYIDVFQTNMNHFFETNVESYLVVTKLRKIPKIKNKLKQNVWFNVSVATRNYLNAIVEIVYCIYIIHILKWKPCVVYFWFICYLLSVSWLDRMNMKEY